ncbi:nucleoside deaminase, partial [Desulfovibrio sp. OttesenSCG-928-A18]|nr:nucleoside deaminase [Desulfovibrio sp. OttesenSCG-928-A18]
MTELVQHRIIPPPPSSWASWEALMERALFLAEEAAGKGEIPVGALLVDGHGRILAESANAVESLTDATAHAEMQVLRKAFAASGNLRLEGSVLVATLEPCLMCAGALAHARVSGLVYGAPDPRAGAVSSCLDGLDLPFLNHRVWHLGGIREAECAQLLRSFFA